MNRTLWLLRHRAPEWGPKIALGLLAVVTVFWLAVLRPLEQRVAEMETQRLSQRDGKLRGIDVDAGRYAAPAERLARFHRFFADGESLGDHLARLYAVANANGIQLRRAEYRMTAQSDQKLARYQIVMPVQGGYPAIRRFVSQALAEMPMLALSQVQLQRKAIGDTAVEAQVTFTLYLAK